MDEKLSLKQHIQAASLKIAKNICIINKVKAFLPQKILLNLYFTLIYPYLSYCNIVWASTYPSRLNKLIILQKRIIRIAFLLPYLEHTKPIFIKFKILNIFQINQYLTAVLVFDFFNSQLPQCFDNFFIKNSNIHKYPTSSSNDLYFPFARTNIYQYTLRFQGPITWSNLPLQLKGILYKSIFKHELKYHLTNSST